MLIIIAMHSPVYWCNIGLHIRKSSEANLLLLLLYNLLLLCSLALLLLHLLEAAAHHCGIHNLASHTNRILGQTGNGGQVGAQPRSRSLNTTSSNICLNRLSQQLLLLTLLELLLLKLLLLL
jgi:hypothetical protein